jgi:hypothetical protein
MAADVQEWIQKWDDDPMVISVSDPSFKTGGFFSSKKTLYVVRASSREKLTSVSREYKDFVLLHSLLNARFRGACIPPVPEEKAMGATKEEFVLKRMHLLEYFLQAIVENPFLRTDVTFDLFISRTEDYEKVVMKGFDKATDSPGLSMWRKALDSVEEPEEPEKLLKDIDKELEVLLKSLKTLKDVAKNHVAAITKYAESTKSLAHAFESWEAREEANISVLRGVNPRVDGSKSILAHELKAIVQGTDATSSVIMLEYGPSQMKLIVVDAIRFEISQAERWQEQVKDTTSRLRQHADAKDQVEKQQQQLGRLTAQAKPDAEKAIKAASDRLAKLKQVEKDVLSERRDYVRGILKIELERYRKQRTLRIETMSALLTRTHLRGANMIKCAWDGTGLEMETNSSARTAPLGSAGGSFFRRKSLTRTASGRLRVKGADSNLEEELKREASTMAAPRNLAIQQDEHKVTLKAKKDYVAKKKDELDLKSGEVVTAVRIDDELWYATNNSGKSGLVPSSHVGVPIAENKSRPSSILLSSSSAAITSSPTSSDGQGSESAFPDDPISNGGPPAGPPPASQQPLTSAPPGMAPMLPPGVPPLPPPSRDPTQTPPLSPFGDHSPSAHHGPPPQPPKLPDFMTRRGSNAFNADLPPLPRNVEAMAALKAKLMSMTS